METKLSGKSLVALLALKELSRNFSTKEIIQTLALMAAEDADICADASLHDKAKEQTALSVKLAEFADTLRG